MKTSYTLCFVNPYKNDYVYKKKPMLLPGLQYNSYRLKDVIYQGQPCDEYIHTYPKHLHHPPNGKYQFKTGLEVPLSKEYSETVLHYKSEYMSESARFFNSVRFWHYCKMFNIDIRVAGPDADKYEIQWEVFLSTNLKNNQFERNVHRDEPNHVTLSGCGWVFPSDGYVITLNRIL